MENPNISILQISDQLGYSSSSNFISQFTFKEGVKPSEWKKKCKNIIQKGLIPIKD